MKIAIVSASGEKYGGGIYEKMVKEVLLNSFDIESINVVMKSNNKFKYFKIPLSLLNLWKISKRKDFDFIIKNFDTSLFLNKRPVRNIAIIHHIDYSYAPLFLKYIYPLFEKIIFHNLKKFDAVVTVSRYWEKYFKEKGYENVYKIYNGFDLSSFDIPGQEVLEFRKNFNLLGKPIIYMGNCLRAKGVVESYSVLKDLDVYLITSGKGRVKIPAINLEIGYRDYLKLLKASSIVVAMSQFKEGWCRVAHEAMLLKTPVIGSGLGGMRELLEGGKQMICEEFSQLNGKVKYLLDHSEIKKKMAEDGYNFAKDFTLERFGKEWFNLIKRLSI